MLKESKIKKDGDEMNNNINPKGADINWFPGHMKKTERLIKDNLKNINMVIEILDARIPKASSNPLINRLTASKTTLKVLNKSDLADMDITLAWLEYFKSKKCPAVAVNAKQRDGIKQLIGEINFVKRQNLGVRPARCMILGVPNVGKSTVINGIVGKNKAKTENRPGVTKDILWLKVAKDLEIMDMPGLTWNKFDDQNAGMLLSITGAVKDEVFDSCEAAVDLISILMRKYPKNILNYYKISAQRKEDQTDFNFSYEILTSVAKARRFIEKGAELDLERAAKAVLNDFRNGKLGRISLQNPKTEDAV